MSGPNRNMFSTPPPGYREQSGTMGQSPNSAGMKDQAANQRFSYSLFKVPPPPPPRASDPPPPPPPSKPPTPESPKSTYSSKFQPYNNSGSGINIQSLNKNSSFLNYQQKQSNSSGKTSNKYSGNYQKSGNGSPSTPNKSNHTPTTSTTATPAPNYLTTQSYTPPTSPYPQYSVGYGTPPLQYSGIAYPPPQLPSPTPPMVFSPNLPPPLPQYSLNPTAYYVPGQPSNQNMGHMAPQHGTYQQHHQQNNGYYQNGYNMRKRTMSGDVQTVRPMKKKKKPLSQTTPLKKEWSVEDATRALAVERELNKLNKSPSLVIKFPDLELNRDIVLGLNTKIDTVHFQQPSTARYCFVTLRKDVDIQQVIKELNKTKFGHGYLTAEHKKDRDETENIGPEDIDPLTLYVGNLAQEVTVDDVHKAYPKHKRVDIGFAKKMKFTRYAFVCFQNVNDAIEAFKSTHASEMYNKSIIVRFRRLHGTVGLPGETKQQNTKKNDNDRKNSSNPENEVAPSITVNDADEEEDHRTIMQRYISRIKQENPDIEEQEDWYYSDDEDHYDTGPNWADRSRNYDRMANNRQDKTPPHQDLTIKSEPEETFSRLQPVIDQVHKPMLEPKTEVSESVSNGTFDMEHRPMLKPKIEVKKDITSGALTGLVSGLEYVHKPMLEPKVEAIETIGSVNCDMEHQPMLEPKKEVTKPVIRGTLAGSEPEMIHRPMIEPKTEKGMVISNTLTGLEPEMIHKPMIEPKTEKGMVEPSSTSREPEADEIHRPMLEPKIEGPESTAYSKETNYTTAMDQDMEMIHRPMLEPKSEPPDLSTNSRNEIIITSEDASQGNSQNARFEVQPIKIKVEKLDEESSISNKNTPEESKLDDEDNSLDEVKIKEEQREDSEKKENKEEDENDSSEDEEESSFDLNNFLSNIKTGKSFL